MSPTSVRAKDEFSRVFCPTRYQKHFGIRTLAPLVTGDIMYMNIDNNKRVAGTQARRLTKSLNTPIVDDMYVDYWKSMMAGCLLCLYVHVHVHTVLECMIH